MKCNKCRNEVGYNSKFCAVCGQNLQNQNINNSQTNKEQTEQSDKQNKIYVENEINIQKDNKGTFKIVAGIFAVIIGIVFIFTIIMPRVVTSQKVEIVKDGCFTDFPEEQGYTTVGEAFDNYFEDTKWRYFVSDDGSDIVEFEGIFLYCNKETHCRLKFELYAENRFKTDALEFNGVPQSNIMINALIDEVMNDGRYSDKY